MDKNTFATWAAFGVMSLGLMGCSKQTDLSGTLPSSPKRQGDIASATTPALQSVLTTWQGGDKSAAVSRFVETDWSARPLFTPGSTLSLSEDQFKSLPLADIEVKSKEITPHLRALKELAEAVTQAGRDAAAKKDFARARKHFTSLKQCGEAIESSDCLLIVKLVGKALRKKADADLAGLGQ
jgi:hypothetical protein